LRVWDAGIQVKCFGCDVEESRSRVFLWFRVQSLGCRVPGSVAGFHFKDLGFRVSVQGSGFRVWGLRFMLSVE